MTCIVGLIKDGVVYIGADSLGVDTYTCAKTFRKDPKVFKIESEFGNMIIGFTSSFRMGQILRFHLQLPEPESDDPYIYIIKQIIPEIRKLFDTHGYIVKRENQESGGNFLIGYKNRLFEIQPNFQVAESNNSFNSCGCGGPYAMAALYTSLRYEESLNAVVHIKNAIKTAEHFSSAVGGNIVIEKIRREDDA